MTLQTDSLNAKDSKAQAIQKWEVGHISDPDLSLLSMHHCKAMHAWHWCIKVTTVPHAQPLIPHPIDSINVTKLVKAATFPHTSHPSPQCQCIKIASRSCSSPSESHTLSSQTSFLHSWSHPHSWSHSHSQSHTFLISFAFPISFMFMILFPNLICVPDLTHVPHLTPLRLHQPIYLWSQKVSQVHAIICGKSSNDGSNSSDSDGNANGGDGSDSDSSNSGNSS